MIRILSNAPLFCLGTGSKARRRSPHFTTTSKSNDRLFSFVNVTTGISKIFILAHIKEVKSPPYLEAHYISAQLKMCLQASHDFTGTLIWRNVLSAQYMVAIELKEK